MTKALVDLSSERLLKDFQYVTLDELNSPWYVKRPGYNKVYSPEFGLVPLQENVRCIIYDMDLESKFRFLLLHASRKDYDQPVQGKLENYETFKGAAIRETQEETGLKSFLIIDGMEEVNSYFRYVDGVRTFIYSKAYAITADMNQDVVLSPFEGHSGFVWSDYLGTAERLLRYPEPIDAVDRVRENLLSDLVRRSYRRDFRA